MPITVHLAIALRLNPEPLLQQAPHTMRAVAFPGRVLYQIPSVRPRPRPPVATRSVTRIQQRYIATDGEEEKLSKCNLWNLSMHYARCGLVCFLLFALALLVIISFLAVVVVA